MSTNGFALLTDKDALLFDTGTEELLPLINQLCDQGFSPRGLVLSHRHIAGLGGAVPVISREYGVPVFLHPLDARHPQAMAAGIAYEDPVGHPLMTAFGAEVVHLPGHTAGSIGLYLPNSARKAGRRWQLAHPDNLGNTRFSWTSSVTAALTLRESLRKLPCRTESVHLRAHAMERRREAGSGLLASRRDVLTDQTVSPSPGRRCWDSSETSRPYRHRMQPRCRNWGHC